MLIPHFMGGLGNMMFQVSSVYSIAKQTGHDFSIGDIPMPPEKHSNIDYTKNILKPWLRFKRNIVPTLVFRENNGYPISLEMIKSIPNSVPVVMIGYFQNATYIEPYRDEILPLFDLPKEILKKYDDIDESYFLHIRRGDYVGNAYHEMDLSNYYKKSVEHIGSGIAYVVSNDNAWCEEWQFLKDIRSRIIKENEVDTLSVMSSCGKGGIAVNSSFSWWGLYLNKNRPYLIVPNKWFPLEHVYEKGYYFDGCCVVST